MAITAALLLLRRRWALALHLWLAWLAWLVPALGLTEHPMFACDRYTYQAGLVPAAALAGLLLWLGATARRRAAAAAGATALVALLGGLTVQQTRAWRDSVALFEHMLPLLGDHPFRINIFIFLGAHQQNRGHHREAVAALSQAVTLAPLDGGLRSGLADSLIALGRNAEAVPHLEVALRFRPGDEALGCSLAASLFAAGRPEESRTQATIVQASHPDSTCARNILARIRTAPPR
ncbi:MAG: tetratricopeptide repeat protein [Anaeromyxobacteraceae bacterium]|nr:tetratricopeptide repeat protein [Anaeromyxobacteraceae bacterium]